MKADMEQDEIEQELECSFTAAILGSYYGKQLNQMRRGTPPQIGKVLFNPGFPVDTFWDIGVGDHTCIWFRQKVGDNWHYIDYFEDNGRGLDHYIHHIRKLGVEKRYRYGRHVWPHDGKVREFGTGLTRVEQAEQLGLRVEIQSKQAVDDRIQATRNRLRMSIIDEENCARGLECLMNYQKEWDSKLMMFKNKPKHDWSSNGSDAFGYSALDKRVSYFEGQRERDLPSMANGEYNMLG